MIIFFRSQPAIQLFGHWIKRQFFWVIFCCKKIDGDQSSRQPLFQQIWIHHLQLGFPHWMLTPWCFHTSLSCVPKRFWNCSLYVGFWSFENNPRTSSQQEDIKHPSNCCDCWSWGDLRKEARPAAYWQRRIQRATTLLPSSSHNCPNTLQSWNLFGGASGQNLRENTHKFSSLYRQNVRTMYIQLKKNFFLKPLQFSLDPLNCWP